jgi:hypothetical protein
MMNISAEWFLSGKLERRTQMPLGFFRGSITCRGLTRFTLKTFKVRDDAELYALSVVLRARAIFEPIESGT